MQDVVERLLSNIERFMRWVYPGLLLLVLLHFGGRVELETILGVERQSAAVQIFALAVIAFVSSFIIYSLHRYVVQEFIEYVMFWFKRGPVAAGACKRGQLPPTWRRIIVIWDFWLWNSQFQRRKFGILRVNEVERKFTDFLMYNWALTHAMGVTAWMIPLVYCRSSPGSDLSKWGGEVLALTILFALAWVWQVGNNTAADTGLGQGAGHIGDAGLG